MVFAVVVFFFIFAGNIFSAWRDAREALSAARGRVGCMQAILQGGTCKVELRAIRIARSLCLGWLGFGLLARLWLVRCARCMILTSSHGMQ